MKVKKLKKKERKDVGGANRQEEPDSSPLLLPDPILIRAQTPEARWYCYICVFASLSPTPNPKNSEELGWKPTHCAAGEQDTWVHRSNTMASPRVQ